MSRTASSPLRGVLTDCVRSATAAPSLHNSQPWMFRLEDRAVQLYADPSRRLDVLDPYGRELFISVGAALFTLRLALQGAGYVPRTEILPDPAVFLLPQGFENRGHKRDSLQNLFLEDLMAAVDVGGRESLANSGQDHVSLLHLREA